MGMGGVFVAVADDANAAYWNRAGLGMLDGWEDGQSQIASAQRIFDSTGIMSRTPRSGNQYYDSFNYAMKINNSMGLGLAGELSGGNAFAISPSVGFKLPWNDKMGIGVGYYLFRLETYDTIGGASVRADILLHRIDFDYLWRFHPEWSFGVHGENFWRLAGVETSPDNPTINVNIAGSLINDINLRPAIAWMPNGDLKGLIVNVGVYDLLAKPNSEFAAGPYLSGGFEYTPQPNTVKIQVKEKTQYIESIQEKLVEVKQSEPKKAETKQKKSRRTKEKKPEPKKVKYEKIKIKVRKPKNIYKEMTVKEDNFLTRSTFRAGIYNYKMDVTGLVTIGYSYRYNDEMEVGYWGGAALLGGSSTVHNFGVAYKF